MAVERSLQLGSGRIYVKKVTDETKIPSLKALCIEANQIGFIKGGATIEYTIDTKEIYDDLRMVNEKFITGEHAKLTSGLLTWNKSVIEALINNETTDFDGSILVGANGLSKMDKMIVIFEAIPNTGNVVRRFGMIGVSDSGLKMQYNPEDATVVDISFAAVADEDGHYIRIEEEDNEEEP
ncbi:MAG: hypothetical protein MJZ55_00240 [Paludibacteraceae bacterium]|nr:hypothetical protein [Paludibacteraceae bacterium]